MTAPVDGAVRALLVRLSAALAGRSEAAVDAALRELTAEAERQPSAALAVEEALLQSYLFLGYPAALEGLRRWRLVRPRPAAPPAADEWSAWAARGAEVCRTVYAGQYDELRANVRALHPDMERWMVTEGYGKVLGRPGLHLMDRELCIAALLAVLDMPRQLYSHLRGALHCGATEVQVSQALGQAAELSSAEARRRAGETWERVRARRAGADAAAPGDDAAAVGKPARGDDVP